MIETAVNVRRPRQMKEMAATEARVIGIQRNDKCVGNPLSLFWVKQRITAIKRCEQDDRSRLAAS